MKKSAFSLVEMLMALLVASLLMAALAPVVTKRMNDTLMVDDISTPGLKVWAEPGEYTFTVPAQTEYLQIQGSAGGGGGGGASIRKIGPIEISSGSFTVPKGVSKVTFTLIGGGGGGGAGYGKVLNDTCDSLVLPAFADSGKDLCVSNRTPSGWNFLEIAKPTETAKKLTSCWVPDPDDATSVTSFACNAISKPTASKYFTGGGCKKPLCNYWGVKMWCNNGLGMRLFTKSEMERIVAVSTPANNFKYLFGEGLDLAIHHYGGESIFGDNGTIGNQSVGICNSFNGNFTCNPWVLFVEDYRLTLTNRSIKYDPRDAAVFEVEAGQVRCVKEINNWNFFAGAGGSSGAKFTKTIDVSPNDVIYFTKGKAGKQGTPGESAVNYSGEESCAIHYNSKEGTNTAYCAKGGMGGNGATEAANGTAPLSSSVAKCTIQKAGESVKMVTEGCSLVITDNGGLGHVPIGTTGGTGAGGLLGGDLDINNGEGQSAANTQYGYGGGGGSCKRGVRQALLCSKGGAGGAGYAAIGYDIVSPGGGGGAGGAVGNNEYLKVKVTPYEIIHITVGAGGNGGQNASFATKGGDIKIIVNEGKKLIEFEGGFGGEPGSFTGEGLNALQNAGIGGVGGRYPDSNFNFMEQDTKADGKQGGLNNAGYDGGQGGKTRLGTKGACGGKQILENICNNNLINGLDGAMHNIVPNKYGGSGGGGGGSDGVLQGTGGEGGAGYVRIRWETNK